jgi:hypothetical protein
VSLAYSRPLDDVCLTPVHYIDGDKNAVLGHATEALEVTMNARSRFVHPGSIWAFASVLAVSATSCGKDGTGPAGTGGGGQGVRIVNGYTQPVDVLVDGALLLSSVAPGTLDSTPQGAGSHTVALRASGTTTSVSVPVSTVAGAWRTIAAVRWGSSLGASALEDTNAIVPAGATKVRVLHLAPNAGEIEVARTQPDWLAPPLIGWTSPFLYDSTVTDPLANPYYQSTVGTWDVRAWLKPSQDSLGWAGATARVTFTLASGEKRTVLVLDKPGGGIQLSVIE